MIVKIDYNLYAIILTSCSIHRVTCDCKSGMKEPQRRREHREVREIYCQDLRSKAISVTNAPYDLL